MNPAAIIENFDDFHQIHFYTLRGEHLELSETDDFFDRMELIPEIQDQLEQFVYWMERIGEGALPFAKAFRHEGIALALPPYPGVTGEHIDLRLYCYALTDVVVILFNGGVKTKRTPDECPNVGPHFKRARGWSFQLQKTEIDTEGKQIENLDDLILNY